MDFNGCNVPKNFIWECTRGCNLGCRHCGSNSGVKVGGELTTAEARDLIDQVADMGFVFLTITGGEPLTRSDIHELIKYASMKGISVTLCTNGSLIDEEIADRLSESGLKCASVSLDGCREFHDANRAETYEKVLLAVHYLRDRGVKVFASMMVSNENLEMLPQVHKTASEHDIKRLTIHTPQECGRAKDNKITLDRDKLIDIIMLANQLRGSGCRVFLDDGFGIYNNRFGCDAARSSMFVSADGFITPCISFPKDSGNVRTEKLIDAWKSSGFEAFREFDYSKLKEPCKGCNIIESCQGGCRAKVFLETCDFFAGNDDCDYLKENAPTLFEKAAAASAIIASGLVLMTAGCVEKPSVKPDHLIKAGDHGTEYDGSITHVGDMRFYADEKLSTCATYYNAEITLEANGSIDLDEVTLYYKGFPLDFEILNVTVTEKDSSLIYKYQIDYLFDERIDIDAFYYGYLKSDLVFNEINGSESRLWSVLPLKTGFPANIYVQSDQKPERENLELSINGERMGIKRISEISGEEKIYLITTENLTMDLSETVDVDIRLGEHRLERLLSNIDSEEFYIAESLPSVCPMRVIPGPSVKSIQYVGENTVVINPDSSIVWEGDITIFSTQDRPGEVDIPIKEISYREDYGHIIRLERELDPGSYIIKSNISRSIYTPSDDTIQFKTKKKATFLHILDIREPPPEIPWEHI